MSYINSVYCVVLCGLISFISLFTHASDTVRYLDKINAEDPQKDYYIRLLKLALEKSEPEYGPFDLQPVVLPMWQDRQLQSLNSGVLDVVWTMTTQAREEEYLPVRIPLMRGLIGFHIPLILKSSRSSFSAPENAEPLMKKVALQGHDWPDVQILRHNGYRVQTTSIYENFFALLQKQGVDYIPRGLLEGFYEINKLNQDVYMLETRNMLVYPTAIYFFTSQHNAHLAMRIESGLRIAQADGSFDSLFLGYQMHKPMFAMRPMRERFVHCLSNPLLPSNFPINDASLWMSSIDADFSVCDFQVMKHSEKSLDTINTAHADIEETGTD